LKSALLQISAQESRRKKKEYMDALERKVEVLTGENTDYKKKIESLEESNASLLSQLQKLEALIARSSTVSTTCTTSHVVRHTDTTNFTTVSSLKDTFKHAITDAVICNSSNTSPLDGVVNLHNFFKLLRRVRNFN
jgi:cell division septum initiation protein DivIVA